MRAQLIAPRLSALPDLTSLDCYRVRKYLDDRCHFLHPPFRADVIHVDRNFLKQKFCMKVNSEIIDGTLIVTHTLHLCTYRKG